VECYKSAGISSITAKPIASLAFNAMPGPEGSGKSQRPLRLAPMWRKCGGDFVFSLKYFNANCFMFA